MNQVARFLAIGVLSTMAYMVIYSLIRAQMPAEAANGIALVITAIGNTAANRRYTFGVRGTERLIRDQAGGLAAFGLALAMTTLAIGLLGALAPDAGRLAELTVLIAASGAATLTRFLLLRRWIASPRTPEPSTHGATR